MQGQALARFIIAILGNIISGFLFLSPTPTIWRIWKNKSTEEFQPYPYLASALNCMLTGFYGLPLVHPHNTLIVTVNSFGLSMEIFYLLIFMRYSISKYYRGMIMVVVLGEVGVVGVVVGMCVVWFKTHHDRSMFVGVVCIVFGSIMYASPLSIIAKVVKTQSTEFMPFWLSLACFLNAAIWFIYAFLHSIDPYIATGTGIGMVFGIVQLSVYAYYSLKPKTKTSEGVVDTEAKAREEVQVQPQLHKISPL